MDITRFSKAIPDDFDSPLIRKGIVPDDYIVVAWGTDTSWIGCVASADVNEVKKLLSESGITDQQIEALAL